MSKKTITVAVAGLGSRGNSYASCCRQLGDSVKIVACADTDADKLKRFADEYDVPEEGRFASAEEMLGVEKLADVMFICTMDRQHYGHAIPALKLGYHLLLEKPASPDPKECLEIARVAKECDRKVVVCHVLRYTSFYRSIKEIIDSGKLGKIMAIQAHEPVVYWHQAHSFVRGNWRREDETSPLILQKCCHDMDILLWLTGSHCKSVSSFGHLSYFKAENAPEGAPERCTPECPVYESCPYGIKHCYLDHVDRGEFGWPMDVVEQVPDAEKFRETLKTSRFGRCVYHCDNDVVDHQVVNLQLDNDITVSFTASAFTSLRKGRRIHVMGTMGDLIAEMDDDKLYVTEFGKPTEAIDFGGETDGFGHGGGDYVIVKDLVDLINGDKEGKALTSIDDSIESHIVCLAAEASRKNEGELVRIDDFVKNI